MSIDIRLGKVLIEEELAGLAPGRDTVVAIGIFDGVHRGHRHLLETLREEAEARDMATAVVTFYPHPNEVLDSGANISYLVGLDERLSLLKELGIDVVAKITFTPEVAQLSAREFVALLYRHLRMRGLVVGPDFALGRSREGDRRHLKALGQEMGFFVKEVRPHTEEGLTVSSTAIREALREGNVRQVARLLGRPLALRGMVVRGDERGQKLGFPTANLAVDLHQALPANGVYATLASVQGKTYPSVTNIGHRPTFGGGQGTVEVHLIDFDGDLYGEELSLEIVERLREERRFQSAEELKAQIAVDVALAQAVLEQSAG